LIVFLNPAPVKLATTSDGGGSDMRTHIRAIGDRSTV
jgi:hypothetical protein